MSITIHAGKRSAQCRWAEFVPPAGRQSADAAVGAALIASLLQRRRRHKIIGHPACGYASRRAGRQLAEEIR